MIDPMREIPVMASRLRERAQEAAKHGLIDTARLMIDASMALEHMKALHVGMCEREERLTARLVALEP